MKKILSIFMIITLLLLLVGCDNRELPAETPTVLAVVIGNHSNSVKYDVNLYEKIKDVYSNFGNICIVSIDGNPELLRDSEGDILGYYDSEYINESKKMYEYKKIWERDYLYPQIRIIQEAIDNCKADDDEVDTLKALQVAAETLLVMEGTMSQNVNKEIIVYDTGLCTFGQLSFLDGEPLDLLAYNDDISNNEQRMKNLDEIVKELDRLMVIPRLSDVILTWYGLGQVSDPQTELSELSKNNLSHIWGQILKISGASPSNLNGSDKEYGVFVFADGDAEFEFDRFVTPVILWDEMGSFDDNYNKSIVLDEEQVCFLGNSDEFVSEDKAREALKPYAENLKKSPNVKVLLCGTTSSFNGGSIYWSERRAKKVKELFVEFGVSSDRIETIGLGYDSILCVDDSPNGEFSDDIGKNNRAVHIIPLDSDLAKEILNNH